MDLDLKDASTGDPQQRELKPPKDYIEANNRRAVRQAIMTQLLSEVADEIIKSNATLTTRDEHGNVTRQGTLADRYNQDKDNKVFPLLRALITDPEGAFNARRNMLFAAPDAFVSPFGSINLVVFRNAMALGDGKSQVNPEEVAKRVVIRAGRSGGYRKQNPDAGFAGCK